MSNIVNLQSHATIKNGTEAMKRLMQEPIVNEEISEFRDANKKLRDGIQAVLATNIKWGRFHANELFEFDEETNETEFEEPNQRMALEELGYDFNDMTAAELWTLVSARNLIWQASADLENREAV